MAVQAQTKSTTTIQQVWLGYSNQIRFSNKWGGWIDLQLRTKENFFTNFSQSFVRGSLVYYINDATKFSIGDAWVQYFPGDNHKLMTTNEHRPWQQFQWHTNYAKTKTMQWVRLEERFRQKVLNDSTLAGGNNFNFRIRYNFLLQVPLHGGVIKKGDVSFMLNNEIYVNLGKQFVYNTFDQNRFFMGLAYYVSPVNYLQFGYSNVFQQLSNGNTYRSIHIARVAFFQNMDWRKKQG